jgi:hypothetical protein
MNRRHALSLTCLLLLAAAAAAAAAAAGDAAAPPVYSNDFAKAAPGPLPDDEFLVLAGAFEVKDVDGEKLLELSPYPLDTFGVLFGPADHATGSVSARAWAATTGRRVPEFGVGTNDAGGYKLWLMPRQKLLALRKADQTVATAPYDAWKSETWTHLRLSVSKAGEGAWKVQGKAWSAGAEEPKEWAVTFADTAEPPAGRASVWGNPYSGKPIRFDDLLVSR